MDLCDLHCDTLTEIYKRNCSPNDISLHITPQKASCFGKYIQVCAVWSDSSLSDEEAWERFDCVVDRYFSLEGAMPMLSRGDGRHRGMVLSVEGARLLCGDISKLFYLYRRGVRLLTLTWAGIDCIGGAWDTDEGLTDFGREVVEGCFELGIVPDVSHASHKVISEVINMARRAGKPIIASHSNSYVLCPHKRNLTDDEFCQIVDLGGIVGVSLYPPHLTMSAASVEDAVRHIRRYVSLRGKYSVALGCDFDGIETTPDGLSDISALPKLYEALCADIDKTTANRVFFKNAYEFMQTNLIL